jgi:hypothetical protein
MFCVTVITDAVILQCFPDPLMMKLREEADGEHETCMLGHVQHFAHSDVDDVCVDDLKVQVSRQAAMLGLALPQAWSAGDVSPPGRSRWTRGWSDSRAAAPVPCVHAFMNACIHVCAQRIAALLS